VRRRLSSSTDTTCKVDQKGYVPALGFRFLTPLYDAVVRMTTRERRFKDALIEQADIQPGQHVLDLACGTGTLAIRAWQTQPQAKFQAVDGDAAVLSLAMRKAATIGAAIRFEQGLSYELPYPDDHFERVLTSLFFHHLGWDDKQRTIHELLRVLKPGGEVHVADWGVPTNGLMRALFLPVQCLDGFPNTGDNLQGKLMPLFSSTGFENVQERGGFNTPLGTLRLFSAVRPESGRETPSRP
tara:strand:+ start:3926 stop:4648 length:723 start_codon:yes stop_codon:yes gene_type:complete